MTSIADTPPIYSPSQPAAESQTNRSRRSCCLISWITAQIMRLRELFTRKIAVTSGETKGDLRDDSPFRQYCANNAGVWKVYMDLANVFDKNLAELFNSDLDPLLIFAGLFSAILSAFLIEIRKGLKEDLQSITNDLLVILIQTQHTSTAPEMPLSNDFVPTLSSRWVNGLWFTSLMFSLVSALGASVAKGWVTQFSSTISGPSWVGASLHYHRLRDLKRWHLKLIIQFLPILIHIAFFLFAAGLVVLLFHDDRAIGIVILSLTASVGAIYTANSVISAYYTDSPFRTPVSAFIRGIFTGLRHLKQLRPFPAEDNERKAHALSWLLVQSTDSETVNAAVRAIAGLPFTPSVQTELALAQDLTSSTLASLLSSELMKSKPNADFVNATMYALLHLVQAAPSEEVDGDPFESLRALVRPGGVLLDIGSMPLSVQALALCLKGRIICLLSAKRVGDEGGKQNTIFPQNAALFETDIPLLAATCTDTPLGRSLIELVSLSSGEKFPKLDVKDVVTGSVTGPKDLQRKYGELLADLALGSAFQNQLLRDGHSANKVCAAIAAEDDVARKSIMNSLISFGKNDKSRHLILDAFPSIMAILNISTSTIFGDIASLLASLAGENEIRKKIATSQFFGRVVTAASEQESYTLMKVCADLVEYQDIRSTTTLENVLSMFWRFIGNSWWHSEATQNILALSEFSDLDGTDIQAAITAPHVQAEILSSLNNAHWGIRVRTLQAIITLSSNQGLRPGFITPGILRRVVSMADDEDEDVREATLNVFVVLSQHGDIRSTAIMPEIQHIVSKLGDGDSGVRQGTLKALVAFCQHEDARVRISHPTIMQYIASFLQSTSWYVRRTTVEVFGALATYDEEDIHVAIRRKETIQKIIPLLGDADVDVRQATLESVFALVKNDTPFAEMATQEMKTKIISMLDDPEDTRQATLWSIVNLIEHDVFAAAISTPEMLQKIISLTDDKDEDVREAALVAIGAFARQPTLLSSVATPAVCGKLLLLLHDEDWNVLQATLVAIGVISKQDDARKVLAIGDGLQNIVKLVDDGDSDVRCAAMECVAAFLSYDKMPAMDITETEKHDKLEIMKSGILSKIFAMVEDEDQDIRIAALNGIAILSRHKVVREHILKTRVLPKIASAAPEDGGGVGPAKLRIAVALTEYADGRAAIAVPEIMVKIVPMLVDADAGTVRDTIAAFSRHDEVHAGIMTPKVLQEMLSALVDEDGDVRQHLVDAIVTLSNHDSGRRAISTMTTIIPMLGRLKDLKNGFQKVITGITEDVKVRTKLAQPEMIEKIGAMLGDQGQSSARKGALDTVVTLAKYDDIRKSIFRMEIIPKVLLRLKDSDANVQKHALESIVALEGIVALAHHSTISPSIATPDTMTKIISLLSEAVKDNLVIRESVVYAVGYFAARVLDADDDVGMRADMINLVSTPQAMQNIGALLVDSDVNVRDKSLHCLRVLLKHDPVKAILLTPNWMVQFVEMLDGRDGDHHVLQLIGSLLEQPDDVSALGTALIQKPLQQIPNTNLYLRKSYTDLIVTLPSSFTFSSNDTDKLVSLLKSPNIAVFQSAVLIVMHFVTNAQFQQDVLKSDIWAELLQRQDTAMMVPAILAEFTLSGKIRVDSALGVVPELLNMFAAGPSDFERWQVGLKGLLALGVF